MLVPISSSKSIASPLPEGQPIAPDSGTGTRCREVYMGIVRVAGRRFGIAGELLSFFWSNKRWWLLPMVGVLFLFGVLLILAQSSVIAPFIYTLF
jgi:hypothetical protein